MSVFQKHPDAEVRIGVDWSDYTRVAGVAIVSSTWKTNPVLSTVTFTSTIVLGALTEAVISGGADNDQSTIENHVVFGDTTGEVFVKPLLVTVKAAW